MNHRLQTVLAVAGAITMCSRADAGRILRSAEVRSVEPALADVISSAADLPRVEYGAKLVDGAKPDEAHQVVEARAKAHLDLEVSADLASKYVWRGINLVNAPVFQPSVSLELRGLKLTMWGSCELTNWNAPNYPRAPAGRFTEFDSTAQYSGKFGDAGWSLGIIDYQFPGTGSKRYEECFGSFGFDSAWGSPSLTLYRGNNRFSGIYATLAMSRSIPTRLVRSREIDLGIELSYGDAQCNKFLYGCDAASLTDVHLHAGTELALGRGWTLTPSLHFSSLLRAGLLDGQPRRTNVWLNLNVGASF